MVVVSVLCVSIRANERRCCYLIYIEEKAGMEGELHIEE